MKKILSVLLSVFMLFSFIPFVNSTAAETTNVALGKSYVAPEAIRGYTASLTDGTASTEFEPASSEWYGLFWNEAAADANCTQETVTITVDLGAYYDISKIRIHAHGGDPNYSIALPGNVTVSVPISSTTSQEICSYMQTFIYANDDGVWLESNAIVTARFVEINIKKEEFYHWIMLNEIEIYGVESDYVPDGDTYPDVNQFHGENLALNKEYTAPEAVRGYTANLTDGIASDEYEIGTSEWYGLFWNDLASDQNCPERVGEITIDLGDKYDLNAINIHFYVDLALSASAPSFVSITTDNGHKFEFDDAFSYSGEFWACEFLNGITTRYVMINIGISNYWVLLNEIEIYGVEVKPSSSVALGASYEAPEPVRGYTASLTDGIFAGVFEPPTSDWYGLFCNAAATDSNAPAGKESVIIDLGNYYDLTKVALHTVSATEYSVSAPLKVEIFACTLPEDGFTSIGEIEPEYDYGVFWINMDVTAQKARYVRFDITLGNYWAMLDEIEVYGALSQEGVPYMLGDISGDGQIGARDYSALKRYCFGSYQLTEEQLGSVDINGDGEVDAKDYSALKRYCFGTYVIKDTESYEFNIVHEEKVFVTDDRLGDLSHISEGNIAVFGNSFIWTSDICEIFNELSADNGQTRQLIDCSDRYNELFSLDGLLALKSEGITAVFLCGFYSSDMLSDVFTIYSNCDMIGIELVIFPAHNENRMLLNGVSIKYPQLYVMDWKAEIDMLIDSGIDRWDMCVDDAHDHSTPLAGYVGAHMIYRAVFGEIPDSTQLGNTVSYDYIKTKLGNYVETGIIQ